MGKDIEKLKRKCIVFLKHNKSDDKSAFFRYYKIK